MKSHREDYIEARDGAITYFSKADRDDDVIKMYEKSKDTNKKMKIVAIVNQKDSHKKVFLDSIEEFNKLKEKVEAESKKENGKDTNVEVTEGKNGEKEISVKNTNGDNNSSDEGNNKDEKNLEAQTEELKKKAKAMEEAGKLLMGDLESINALKNSLMDKSVNIGIILEARQAYEQAQDRMNMATARYMVEKNVLVAKREVAILDINRAIARGEDVSDLQYQLIELNNQVENLDSEYEQIFPMLQNEVSSAYANLQETSKEVTKKVSADFKNSYKQIRNYSEDGILQTESTDLTKNLNRVVLNTAYNENIVADGKLPAINAQTININGQAVRVVSTEYAHGVETAFLDGNVEQMRSGAGNIEYVTRDENGSLIADNPELEDVFKRIGIDNVDDIQEACDEIDKKAKERDAEEDIEEDYEYPNPSLNNYD